MQKAKTLSSRLLAGEELPVKSDYPLPDRLPKGLKSVSHDDGASFGMAITIFSIFSNLCKDWLHIIPRSVYLGIGCRKGASQDMLDRAAAALEDWHIDPRSVAGVGTIDLKKDEPGLIGWCQERGWTLHWYTAEQLMALPGNFTASAFVEKITGADNVCERAAVMASGGGKLLFGKYAGEGVTIAGAEKFFSLSFDEMKPDSRNFEKYPLTFEEW
jgi:cobalt-precorrin 5A hydrolase